MGTSTDGQICYGIKFEEDFEFPWDSEEYKGDIEEWWLAVSGYVSNVPCPYDEHGEYLPGFSREDERVAAYWGNQHSWKESHPCPVELVNYQHCDYATYILAIPSTVKTANRGYPVQFNPEELKVATEEVETLKSFCEQHGIEYEGEPSWYLSSYWG